MLGCCKCICTSCARWLFDYPEECFGRCENCPDSPFECQDYVSEDSAEYLEDE